MKNKYYLLLNLVNTTKGRNSILPFGSAIINSSLTIGKSEVNNK